MIIDAFATNTMNGTSSASDMEMMETETSNQAAVTSQASDHNDSARSFITAARQFIDQGQPSQALQAVLMAMKASGGEAAVFQILQRARELYVNRVQAGAQADQLASLFAECAIAEAQPGRLEPSSLPMTTLAPAAMQRQSNLPLAPCPDAYGTSILAESGRKQVVLDAFADGSSFICLKCGGLVSNHRKDEHFAHWCQA